MPKMLQQKLGQWSDSTRRWCETTGMIFFANEGQFTFRQQGKDEHHCVYHDEGLNHRAVKWVREHAFVKGKPNMTAQSFCDWVNNNLLLSCHLPPHFPRSISLKTAIRWLHHLGFKPVSHKKGVYIDGHE